MSESLYSVNQRYNEALSTLFEMHEAGEIDADTLADTMESVEGELTDKAINVAAYIRNLESFAAEIKQAEKAMSERRMRHEKKATHLRDYLFSIMTSNGISEIPSTMFDLKIKKTPPAVYIANGAELPDEYLRVSYAPDKTALKKAVQSGVAIDGVEVRSGKKLDIK